MVVGKNWVKGDNEYIDLLLGNRFILKINKNTTKAMKYDKEEDNKEY